MFSAATTTRITLGATTSSVRSRKTTTAATVAFGRPTQKPAGMRAALAPAAIELKAERRVAGVARRASVVTYVRRRRRNPTTRVTMIATRTRRRRNPTTERTDGKLERVKRGISLFPRCGLIAVSETRFTYVRRRRRSCASRRSVNDGDETHPRTRGGGSVVLGMDDDDDDAIVRRRDRTNGFQSNRKEGGFRVKARAQTQKQKVLARERLGRDRLVRG